MDENGQELVDEDQHRLDNTSVREYDVGKAGKQMLVGEALGTDGHRLFCSLNSLCSLQGNQINLTRVLIKAMGNHSERGRGPRLTRKEAGLRVACGSMK